MTCNMSYKVVPLLIFVVYYGESARILAIFPFPSYSHQIVFRPLMRELATRGHEVVVITTDPAYTNGKPPPNLTEIDVHDKSYNIWREQIELATGIKSDILQQITNVYSLTSFLVEMQFNASEVQNVIYNKHKTFDLLFLELFPRLAAGYAHLLRVPVIQFSSFGGMRGTFETMGAPSHCIIYPIASCTRVFNLSLWEEMSMFYSNLILHYIFYNNLRYADNAILKRSFGQDAPDIEELRGNASFVFLNTNHLWSFNRPLPVNVINLSGIHQNIEGELPKDVQDYLDNSKNGVIYMSLGTNSKPSSFPLRTIKVFTNVLAQFSYDVLLKWDEDHLPDQPKNVKIAKWLPQSNLLGHPNIKVFITQGGSQSSEEAINAGVPLVALPLLIDQWYNSEMYEFHKIGIMLNIETLTEYAFKNAIRTVIEDESYRENIRKLRSLMQDQAQTSLQKAVWWTEYVLRYGAEHLRSPAANMSWTDYYELELVCLITISVLVFFTVTSIVIKLLCSYFLSKILVTYGSFCSKIKYNKTV